MPSATRRWTFALLALLLFAVAMPAQQMVTETRDPNQAQDEDFARSVKEWTTQPYFMSPLVDHLPKIEGVPSPKDVLGYHVGAPAKLTYYADILSYYRALAAAMPDRVRIEPIGKSDEDRELVVIWISSDENIKVLQKNRDNLAQIADPRGRSDAEIRQLIATTKPQYHLMGGLHSGETGPSEMLMELAYRLATETSPLIRQIRDHVYVSITPVADPDGRDRNVDWFYRNRDLQLPTGRGGGGGGQGAGTAAEGAAAAPAGGGRGAGTPGVPYWGKYVFHDNNRDINLSQVSMRALTDWYFTAHPPIMHDLHESQPLLYTYSGAAPQNPNLDPILFAELPFFSNFELTQMTKWGMPGVYTHAFMDGWSPGYLGSVAYNHNGMMRMYETQAGSDITPPSAPAPTPSGAPAPATSGRAGTAPAAAVPAGRGRGRGAAPQASASAAPAASGPATAAPAAAETTQGGRGRGAVGGRGGAAEIETTAGRGAAGAVPTGRGGGQPREWYRGLPIPAGALANWSRRNNANYMQTGVLSGLQLTSMIPNLVIENFYQKTRNSIEAGKTEAPFGFVIPVQRDMTRVAELITILRAQGIEIGRATAELRVSDGTFPAGSPRTCWSARTIPTPTFEPTTTAAGRWGWRCWSR